MRNLLLIRHGQASFGADDYDCLSPTGEEQSCRLGEWLAAGGTSPDLVAIGPRRRHRHTAELCLATAGLDPEIVMLDGLDELDHLEVLARLRPDLPDAATLKAELKQLPDPHRAFHRLFAEAVGRWVGGAHDGEYTRTWPEFRAATLEALATLAAHPARTIWAFTSGGPIAVIANALMDAPPAQAFRLSWPLVNTGMTRIKLGEKRPSLVTYNSWPHLERESEHHLITLR